MEVEYCVLVVAFLAALVLNFGLELINLKLAGGLAHAVVLEVSLDTLRIKTARITLLYTWSSILVAAIVIEINMFFRFMLLFIMIRSNPEVFELTDLTDMALKLQWFLNRDKLVLAKVFWVHKISKGQLAHVHFLCMDVAESVDENEYNEEHREEQIRINELFYHEEVGLDPVAEQVKQVAFLVLLRSQRFATHSHL